MVWTVPPPFDPNVSPLISFEKHRKQERFVFSKKPKTAAVGAIRSGKTKGSIARLLWLSDLYPGSQFLVGRKDFTDLYTTTLKDLFAMVSARNGADWRQPGPAVVKYDGEFHDLYLRTKGDSSVLHFRHLKELHKQLGDETTGYLIDQAEEVEEEIYSHITSRTTYWNTERSAKFKERYGYIPRKFEMLTANPDPGWIKALLLEQEDVDPRDKWELFQFNIRDNEENLPPDYIESMERTHPKSWCVRWLDGDWNIKGGAIYEEFDEDIHGIEEFSIPSHWPRFLALDWGLNHPTAAHWGAVNEYGWLYVYDELFVRGKLVSEVAKMLKGKTAHHTARPEADMEGGLLVAMDPSTNQHHGIVERSVMSEFREHGIYGRNANNDVLAGINKVRERLHHDLKRKPPIKPTVFIFKNKCPELIKGLKTYAWQPPNQQGIFTERPIKKDDDSADSFRYLNMAVLESTSGPRPPQKKRRDEFADFIVKTHMLPRDPHAGEN